jgi:hypothetical protein
MTCLAGTSFLPQERGNESAGKPSHKDPATDGRLRRTPHTNPIEKRVIKDSMVKVVALPKTSIQRLAV